MTKTADQLLDIDEKKEIEKLKARIAELENPGKKMTDTKIQLDDYIPVMSLLPYRLNLSTREAGMGDTKKFTKFGEVKNILYKDLVDIMEVHSNFMEAGYFYIMNPSVIRQHGLDEIYSKILTKEKIEEILCTSSDNSIALYNSANEQQREIIVRLLINKYKDDPASVDLNIIDKISRISNIDISKKAEESRTLETLLTNKE